MPEVKLISSDSEIVLTAQPFGQAWKFAASATHPDTGGSAEDFTAAIAARDRIKELKGWS